MKLTRAQRDILWSDFRADDSGRATALGHWFAVADIAYHADPDAVPRAWRFRHGATGRDCLAEMLECQAATGHEDCDCPWPDCDYATFVEAGPYGVQMLVHAGDVLGRYMRRHYCDECELTRSRCECEAGE